jgi:hypothetical protein
VALGCSGAESTLGWEAFGSDSHVSYKTEKQNGEMGEPYGPNPVGFLTLTADGRMSVIMADARRKPLDLKSTDAEIADALFTFFAYAGTYRLTSAQLALHIAP